MKNYTSFYIVVSPSPRLSTTLGLSFWVSFWLSMVIYNFSFISLDVCELWFTCVLLSSIWVVEAWTFLSLSLTSCQYLPLITSSAAATELQAVPRSSPSEQWNLSRVGCHQIDYFLYYHKEFLLSHLYYLLGLELQFYWLVLEYLADHKDP